MRRRTSAFPIALTILVGAGTACGGGSTPDPVNGIDTLQADEVARVSAPRDPAVVDRTVKGIDRFGGELVGRLAGEPASDRPSKTESPDNSDNPENLVVSPLSAAYAFGMLQAGARGETRRQINETFGFPDGGPHRAFNASSRDLVSTDDPPAPAEEERDRKDEAPEPTVAIANGLFLDEGFEPSESYLRVLAEQYGAGVQRLDLDDPEAVDRINQWVSERTAERIPKLFEDLEAAKPKLILANAIYLKAEWSSAFSESDTAKKPFRAPAGEVRVPMMRQETSYRYMTGDGYEAVELPYVGGDLAMRIVLPDSGSGGSAPSPSELLAPEALQDVDNGLESRAVDLSMPKFDFANEVDLDSVLPRMGMDAPMDQKRADLSGIAPDLYVEQAAQRANISVDEDGTEAAAVTGVEGGAISAPSSDDPVRMQVDRPFAFTIVHTDTGTPLFLGQVTDPTAS